MRKITDAEMLAFGGQLFECFDELMDYAEDYASIAEPDDPVHELLPRWRKVQQTGRFIFS